MDMFGKRYREREASRWEREAVEKRAQEKTNQERGERGAERLRAQVRADLEAAEAARAAEAAELARMTPAQLAAREHRLQTQAPAPGPAKPDGYFLAREAILREDPAREREQQEREQDLPRRRDEWDAQVREIDAVLDAALDETRRRCAESEQAARERAETERAELGARPTLEAEAVAVCP